MASSGPDSFNIAINGSSNDTDLILESANSAIGDNIDPDVQLLGRIIDLETSLNSNSVNDLAFKTFSENNASNITANLNRLDVHEGLVTQNIADITDLSNDLYNVKNTLGLIPPTYPVETRTISEELAAERKLIEDEIKANFANKIIGPEVTRSGYGPLGGDQGSAGDARTVTYSQVGGDYSISNTRSGYVFTDSSGNLKYRALPWRFYQKYASISHPELYAVRSFIDKTVTMEGVHVNVVTPSEYSKVRSRTNALKAIRDNKYLYPNVNTDAGNYSIYYSDGYFEDRPWTDHVPEHNEFLRFARDGKPNFVVSTDVNNLTTLTFRMGTEHKFIVGSETRIVTSDTEYLDPNGLQAGVTNGGFISYAKDYTFKDKSGNQVNDNELLWSRPELNPNVDTDKHYIEGGARKDYPLGKTNHWFKVSKVLDKYTFQAQRTDVSMTPGPYTINGRSYPRMERLTYFQTKDPSGVNHLGRPTYVPNPSIFKVEELYVFLTVINGYLQISTFDFHSNDEIPIYFDGTDWVDTYTADKLIDHYESGETRDFFNYLDKFKGLGKDFKTKYFNFYHRRQDNLSVITPEKPFYTGSWAPSIQFYTYIGEIMTTDSHPPTQENYDKLTMDSPAPGMDFKWSSKAPQDVLTMFGVNVGDVVTTEQLSIFGDLKYAGAVGVRNNYWERYFPELLLRGNTIKDLSLNAKLGIIYVPGNSSRYSYDPVTSVRTELETSDELVSRKYTILYAYENISHLSDYALGIASNGSHYLNYVRGFPDISVNAGQYITLRRYDEVPGDFSANQQNLLGYNGSDPIIYVNVTITGDDRVELLVKTDPSASLHTWDTKYNRKDWALVDSFGDFKHGYFQPWCYQDGYAWRKTGTKGDGTFKLSDWYIVKDIYPTDFSYTTHAFNGITNMYQFYGA